MSGEGTQVLLSVEAEAYVQALERFDVKEIGSQKWSRQHEYIEKLNMQAVIHASAQEDEFVKEYLISYEKIPVLIHELIATEVWKQKIFTEFVNMEFQPTVTFPIYMVLYHEATVINILETIMFHQSSCEAAEDSILDLLDYCYRKVTELVARKEEDAAEDDAPVGSVTLDDTSTASTMEELEKLNRTLAFDIDIKAVSILRYIIDNISSLPLSAMTRILNTQDIPILLVELVENPPWTRRKSDGTVKKYVDSKWQVIPPSDMYKLTKIEGQVWIALFQLLMNQDCQQKYDLTSYRKNVILKLRSYLNEILLDQMPILVEFQRFLEHLSIMDPPPPQKDLVLEQIPEIRDDMLKRYERKWKKLAKKQSETYFNPKKADLRDQAKRWTETYNFDVLEGLLTDPPKCAVCGAEAAKRCSRCQNEWYCRRECQVSHWKKHKTPCDLMYDSLQKIKEEEQKTQSSEKS